MIETLLYYVAAVAGAAFQLASACHALLNKRDPRSQLGWLVLCIMLPMVGAIAYWILGVNRIRDEVAWDGNTPVKQQRMMLSLTWDHRAVDGAYAAAFLSRLREIIEKWERSQPSPTR